MNFGTPMCCFTVKPSEVINHSAGSASSCPLNKLATCYKLTYNWLCSNELDILAFISFPFLYISIVIFYLSLMFCLYLSYFNVDLRGKNFQMMDLKTVIFQSF